MNQTAIKPTVQTPSPMVDQQKLITIRWTLFGVAIGVIFPIVGTIIEIIDHKLPFLWASIGSAQSADPLLWIIDIAPLILGLTFYAFEQQEARLRVANQQLQEIVQKERALQNNLEQRVQERTNQLSQESEMLRSSTLIARSISELQDIPALLDKAVRSASDLFGFYHVAIYLFDEERRMAFLQAASTDIGKKMMDDGFYIEGNPKNVIGYVSEQNKPYIIADTNDENKARLKSEGRLELTRSQIVIPLTARGKVTGIMDCQSEEPRTPDQNETEILQSLADQIAISVDNARLLDETQAFVNELESLTTQHMGDVWKRYLANRGLAYQYTPSGIKLITSGQVKIKNKKSMQVPLRLRGRDIGMITFQGKETAQWTASAKDLVEKIASQVVLALDNSRLLEETRQHAIRQQTINEISTRLSRSLDTDTLLQAAARELGSLPEVAEVSVVIESIDENKQVSK